MKKLFNYLLFILFNIRYCILWIIVPEVRNRSNQMDLVSQCFNNIVLMKGYYKATLFLKELDKKKTGNYEAHKYYCEKLEEEYLK